MSVRIVNWGTAVPTRVLTNPELNERLDLPPDWIENRTGITARHIVGCHDSTATLATDAARDALSRAQLDPNQIDLLIVATTTPEQPIPSTAAFVAGALDLHCGSMDINTACTGFVTAYLTAAAILKASTGHHALVIGAETYSRIVNPNDRSTAVVFGDAAGAVVLEDTPNTESGLLAWDLGCDPSGRGLVELVAGGSRHPTTIDSLRAGSNYLHMSGRKVFEFAVPTLIDSVRRTLRRAEIDIDEITLFVPHQANARILEQVADGLGLNQARVAMNIDRFGNTAAASIPLALAEAANDHRITPGELVLMAAVGAGMTWGSLLIRW
jgi:3-oxoacyl-[acyl-carrier-protein] synthase III